ncbi:transglutaminase domain-containing protein [Agromyces intestinalis]|uniref:Transglutaminase domain-containing protein n=1 Tax=Agromyces intestinalis TaxID=2592652 RepID=A0A5C1YID8_9MICO|nr:transglutaminase-like domain-containing protein [Agromyces intestinalis]QEO15285.1 transglutaminase domain-containing protein [Agromyces intestinalis]
MTEPVASHSPFSDPGRHRTLVAAIAPDPAAIHRAVTSTIVHYRADPVPATDHQQGDIDLRWIAALLDVATERADGALDAPRPAAARVGGCCRDHSLLGVSILREHGVPARTRLGFADYFTPGYRHDHVVIERYVDGRWSRFDPELDASEFAFDIADLPTGEGAPFETAAEAWLAYRAGRTDLATYGVGPGAPFGGPGFVQGYVIGDIAHRHGCELLLWDGWGAMAGPSGGVPDELAAFTDRLARLTVAADAGDAGAAEAERELAEIWRTDDRVRPGSRIRTFTPHDRVGVVDLETRTTEWSPTA